MTPARANRLHIGLAVLFIAGPLGSSAQETLALTNAFVIDGTGRGAESNQTIIIEDGRIRAAGRALMVPGGARVVDVGGRYVIPGLIDAHVHLATDPSGNDARERVEPRLAMALRWGVTSVRDMAGDARALAALARDARSGAISSPTIYYSALLGGPDFFEDPRAQAASRGFDPGTAPWARAVTGDSDYREIVRQARDAGATGIKLYAGLSPDVLVQATAEGHRQGLEVWSHATVFPGRPADAIRAGVNSLSHAAYLVWEAAPEASDWRERRNGDYHGTAVDSPAVRRLLREMRAANTGLDATLWIQARQWLGAGAAGEMPEALRWAAAATAAAHKAGVTVSAGTDDIGDPETDDFPNLHRELELLVTYAGFTPLEAITAATRNGALALGMEASVGTLRPGMVADLVVLERNPAEDIQNTRTIFAVVKHGQLVRRSPG